MKLFDVIYEGALTESEWEPIPVDNKTPSKDALKRLRSHYDALCHIYDHSYAARRRRLTLKYKPFSVAKGGELSWNYTTLHTKYPNDKFLHTLVGDIHLILDKSSDAFKQYQQEEGQISIQLKQLNTEKYKTQDDIREMERTLAVERKAAKVEKNDSIGPVDEASVLITDPKNMPKLLPTMVGLKPSLENPYLIRSAVEKYAGHVSGFTFTPTYTKYVDSINAALKRNGIPQFTIVYAGNYQKRTSNNNFWNYIVYGAGGKFVLKKYDVGGGSGQFFFYIKGVKTQNGFQNQTNAQQDQTLRKWFPEYFK